MQNKKTFPPSLFLHAFLFLSFITGQAFAQQGKPAISWKVSPYEDKVFIENKGQFDGMDLLKRTVIHYGVDNMGSKAYFKADGMSFRFDQVIDPYLKHHKSVEPESEMEGEEEALETKSYTVHMQWLNSNPNVQLKTEELVPQYYNYPMGKDPSKSINFAKAYKKLIYKDLYPGIDLEYTFPDKGGMKYALIVHPGADPSQIRMKYSGATKISKDDEGNIRLGTAVGDVIDHAPFTYYQGSGKAIGSFFAVNDNEVSFAIGSYDGTQTLVIDPWTINPAMTTDNKAYDIEHDAAGNVFIFGGLSPYKLKKFTPGGTLIWTTNSTNNNQRYGDLAVTGWGTSYITAGHNGCNIVPSITKVNSLGVIQWNNTIASCMEFWAITATCDGKIVVQDSFSPSGGRLSNIDTTNGNRVGSVQITGGSQDFRASCLGPNGNYYMITAITPQNVVGCTPGFGTIFNVNSGHTSPYNGTTLYANGPNPIIAGFNGIAASMRYVYHTDGAQIWKRNITNGALVTQIAVPGGGKDLCCGIAVDGCGNVFVGSQSTVLKYDSNLTLLTTTNTGAAVYDVTMGMNGEVLVCGFGFASSLALSSPSCIFPVVTNSNPAACGSNNGSATASVSSGGTGYSYSWSNGQTGQTATGLGAGTYTVTVTHSITCNVVTTTVAVTGGGGSFTVNSSQNNVLCNGGTTGSASATASGGTSPYTYSWNPGGQTNQTATGLGAGTYTVTVTDATGCSGTKTLTITQPVALVTGISTQTNVSCNGGNNGSATVTASGGTGAMTFSWAPSGGTGATGTGMTAGTYTVTVTDGNGCTKTATVTITQPTVLNAGISASTTVNCNGGNNGTATVTASGGTGAMTFTWNNGQATATATGLTAGTYTATVTDANGCTKTATVTITQPTVLALNGSATTATCGGSNGTATVTASGGTINYTYSWNNGQTNQTATGLGAGTYTVTVTDSKGCTKTFSVAVNNAGSPTAGISTQTNVLCFGGNNGSATATASGGTGALTYSWNNGQTGANATGLTAGTYTVTVTDQNGCSAFATVTITQPAQLTAGISGWSNPNCTGGNNGTASATANGGTGAITYTWSTGQTGNSVTGLTAGTYTVTSKDANNCTQMATVVVSQPTALVVGISTQTNVSCNGGNNGSATATSTGGSGGIQFVWSTGQSAATATGLSAGSYTVTAQDVNGCTKTAAVTITQPSTITLQTSTVSSTCGQSNGTATVTASGGTGAFTYSWSAGAQTTQTATGLAANTYTVLVTDANGCTKTITVSVVNAGSPTVGISAQTNVSCFGGNNGTATATASGGTGALTYSWSPNGGTGLTGTGMTAGTYTITVTDQNGCSATATVTITQPTQLTAAAAVGSNVSCTGGNNGSAGVTAAGGTVNYTYSWNNGQTNQTATGLIAGTYTVTVTDSKGCTATATATVTQPTQLTAGISAQINVSCNGGNNGSATVTAAGGLANYTFLWNNTQTTTTATSLTAGTYTVTVTDANNCTATATVTITQPALLTLQTSTIGSTCGQANGSASVTASGGTGAMTYSWSNGQLTQTATGLMAATYTVTVTDGNNCTATATASVTNSGSPTAGISAQTNVSCFGGNNGTATATATGGTGTLTYTWAPSGGNTSTGTGLSAGTFTVTVTDQNGCSATATVTIAQPTQLIAVAAGTTTCQGTAGTAGCTANGGTTNYNYLWSNGQAAQVATGLSTGVYTVTVTDANNCTATATANVTVNPLPVIIISASDTAGCAPLCVNFTCTTGNITSWTWDFGDAGSGSSNTSTLQNPSHCFKNPGTYDIKITVTDGSGCSATITKTAWINVYPNVVAAFTAAPQPTTILNPLITFTDQSTGANTWNWTFGESSSGSSNTSSLQNPTHAYKDSGCYNVELIANNQYNCPDTASQQVCIAGDYELYAPNAFTPNGDGLNDLWNVKGIGIDPNHFELYIFDRWGNLIYYADDMNKGWDGHANHGRDIAQQDVYVWKCFTRDFLGGKHSYIGHINLVR